MLSISQRKTRFKLCSCRFSSWILQEIWGTYCNDYEYVGLMAHVPVSMRSMLLWLMLRVLRLLAPWKSLALRWRIELWDRSIWTTSSGMPVGTSVRPEHKGGGLLKYSTCHCLTNAKKYNYALFILSATGMSPKILKWVSIVALKSLQRSMFRFFILSNIMDVSSTPFRFLKHKKSSISTLNTASEKLVPTDLYSASIHILNLILRSRHPASTRQTVLTHFLIYSGLRQMLNAFACFAMDIFWYISQTFF